MPLIRVSCVSFLNSLPFVYGLKNHPIAKQIQLSLDNPAESAFKLREGIVDIGLIPVAAIQGIPNANSITNWCIGSDGPVKSVTLLSEVPLNEIKNIILDFQSVTSNLLVQILAKYFWKINPEFIQSRALPDNKINGKTAAVIIGDRSLAMQSGFKYVYDLAGEWKSFTGLPFVFARWVSNRPLEKNFLQEFDEAMNFGIDHIDEVIKELINDNTSNTNLETYLKSHLSYIFDFRKQKGMDLFLEYAGKIKSRKITELQ